MMDRHYRRSSTAKVPTSLRIEGIEINGDGKPHDIFIRDDFRVFVDAKECMKPLSFSVDGGRADVNLSSRPREFELLRQLVENDTGIPRFVNHGAVYNRSVLYALVTRQSRDHIFSIIVPLTREQLNREQTDLSDL